MKLNEESDLNKLLQLRKQELETDKEYEALKGKLNKRTRANEAKEAEFTEQYKKMLDELEKNELPIIEKLQVMK